MLALIAVMGGLCGFAASASRVAATTCADPNSWGMDLETTTSTDPNVDHRPLWPAQARLSQSAETGTKPPTITLQARSAAPIQSLGCQP